MIVYISYDNNNEVFLASTIITDGSGLMSINCEHVCLDSFPNLSKKLKEDKMIYIKSFHGYLGSKQKEGPYGERQVFNSEYESENTDVSEILIDLEKKVKAEKKHIKKLTRCGNYYK
jgi:hypothetical protein